MNPKPWLDHYDQGIPPTLAPYPDRTLLDFLAEAAIDAPHAPALLFKGATVTYGELEASSNAFAAALVELGVRKGDLVGFLLPNCPQIVIGELGAWKAGAVAVPLNPMYTDHELKAPLADTAATVMVALTLFYKRFKAIQRETAVRHVIVTNIKEYFAPLLRLLFTVAKEKKDGHRVAIDPEDLWFADLLRGHAAAARPDRRVAPKDAAIILLSGGTTGTPKGVVGRHEAYVMAGLQAQVWGQHFSRSAGNVLGLPLPLFHVYAQVGVLSFGILSRGAIALIPNPRDLRDLLRTIQRVRPNFFYGVPSLYIAILNHPDVQAGKIDLSSIRICGSGAAALMAETKSRFEALTGSRLLEGYSLTEAMMACIINPMQGRTKTGSIGMPLPDVEVRIADVETGEGVLPPGQTGEILVRAPQLMSGYWNSPAETANVLRVHGEGGPWLHTGDLGYMDEDGYVFVVDRKKDLIKTSGFQVWPREVEEVLSAHPAVAEVGVAGVPDVKKGEAVKAWVVLRSKHAATEDELRTFCRERLAPYKVPARIEFRSELPKTMVGKVLRRALETEAPQR
jgi:long-chain acyl-CoA synthetase